MKTIVIVAVTAGVSIASVLGILFAMDAYQQPLFEEEYQQFLFEEEYKQFLYEEELQKIKLAFDKEFELNDTQFAIDRSYEELDLIYQEVHETCVTNPLVYDTESLLSCVSKRMASIDETYVTYNRWWNTIPEYRDYQILYYDETQKCIDSPTETLGECYQRAIVYAQEQTGFSNELLE